MLLQIPFLELLYLHRLVKCSCRCFFLLICKNIHPQLVFSLLADTLLQNLHPQLPFSLSCRYSPSKICIHNLLFLYLADTPLQKFASATCFFSILQILPCKNLHPQLAFSLSCRYSTLQHTLLFNLLWIFTELLF